MIGTRYPGFAAPQMLSTAPVVYAGSRPASAYPAYPYVSQGSLQGTVMAAPRYYSAKPAQRAALPPPYPGDVDMSRVYVQKDQWGGHGVFARFPIAKGELVEKGIVRLLDGLDGNINPFVFTWSEGEPRKWAEGSGASEELTHVYISATWRKCFADLKPLAEEYLAR